MTIGYVAETVPAKIVRASGTTLFEIAMRETGDAMQWPAIARLNGIVDPWLTAQVDLLIPPVFPNGEQSGILGL